jgi:hypothetical protein
MVFKNHDQFVLPTSGTIGKKAQNLIDNLDLINRFGFKVPKTLVVPKEYLKDKSIIQIGDYVLNETNNFFPNWDIIYLRSNVENEDSQKREPGKYESVYTVNNWLDSDLDEDIKEEFPDCNNTFQRDIKIVTQSGLHGLMVQNPAFNPRKSPGYGSVISNFCDISKFSRNYSQMHNSMLSPPDFECWVNSNDPEFKQLDSFQKENILRLDDFLNSLPKKDGKGWEVEFVSDNLISEIYIVQTTPVKKNKMITISTDDLKLSKFFGTHTLGSGKFKLDGILYARDIEENLEYFADFNSKHKGYGLALPHSELSHGNIDLVSRLFSNSAGIFDLIPSCSGEISINSMSSHFNQEVRENRFAIRGFFVDELHKVNYSDLPLYSDSKFIVQANEPTNSSSVNVIGILNEFKQIL